VEAFSYPKLREHVIAELDKVGAKMKRNGEEMTILCPFHQDSHPSLEVHVGLTKLPGIFKCWSCKKSGHWNDLARALRLQTLDYGEAGRITEKDDPFALLAASLKHVSPLKAETVEVRNGLEPLSPGFKWRGYDKAFYEKFGAKFWWQQDIDMDWMHIPLTMNQRYLGYTLCALKPHKPKYMTFADTLNILFLYDSIPTGSPIVLVEGHFDALRLMAEGIPAVAIFGTSNWSPVKKSFLIAKAPPRVLILMDGDQSGYQAAQEIFVTLRGEVPVDISYLPILPQQVYIPERNEYIDKMDPGNMPETWLQDTRQRLGITA
jgi:hypothetical protein